MIARPQHRQGSGIEVVLQFVQRRQQQQEQQLQALVDIPQIGDALPHAATADVPAGNTADPVASQAAGNNSAAAAASTAGPSVAAIHISDPNAPAGDNPIPAALASASSPAAPVPNRPLAGPTGPTVAGPGAASKPASEPASSQHMADAYVSRPHLSPAIQSLWRLRDGTLRPRPTAEERAALNISSQEHAAAWPMNVTELARRIRVMQDALSTVGADGSGNQTSSASSPGSQDSAVPNPTGPGDDSSQATGSRPSDQHSYQNVNGTPQQRADPSSVRVSGGGMSEEPVIAQSRSNRQRTEGQASAESTPEVLGDEPSAGSASDAAGRADGGAPTEAERRKHEEREQYVETLLDVVEDMHHFYGLPCQRDTTRIDLLQTATAALEVRCCQSF